MSDAISTVPWYADGLDFSCTRCGNCCGGAPGYVWISPAESQAIAQQLGLTLEQFERVHTRPVGKRRSLLELENGDCEFLVREADGLTRCAIHAVRPLQCRTWPFWKSNMVAEQAWEQAARHCPGIGRGKPHPLAFIQEALRQNREAKLPL